MSSWWAKDDTRDQKEGTDEGLKNNNNKPKRKVTKNETKLKDRVTQLTQSCRVRGVTIDSAGNKVIQQTTEIVTICTR